MTDTHADDDTLTLVAADLRQLSAEVQQSDFRPSAGEICARLNLLAVRVSELHAAATPLPAAAPPPPDHVDEIGVPEEATEDSSRAPRPTRKPRKTASHSR